MSQRYFPVLKAILFVILLNYFHVSLNAQSEKGNEYRITLFPSHKITEKITGFAYLGYVWNPEKNYQTYYLGYPAACYSFKPWLQIWGGLVGLYTNNETSSDKLELRPFVGPKLFLPNKMKWNIYNFTRYEFRATQDRETHDWSNVSRLRSRFGVEFEPGKIKIENITQYTSLCARALALAHAKSGDAAMISGYAGNSDELDEAMSRFGAAYADQTEKDYNKLAAAAKSGRIKVAGA